MKPHNAPIHVEKGGKTADEIAETEQVVEKVKVHRRKKTKAENGVKEMWKRWRRKKEGAE